jgi:very-short-patch-repair endonuclease
MEVCEFLRDKGYAVDTQVGCSSFKIDLALKHPHSSNYLLAIECDGATYHSSKNARDRDRLRQAILENMGWKFYRIWSTDWFRNKRVEKERLLSAVKEAIDSAPRVHTKSDEPEISFEERVEEKHFEFPKYQMVNVFNVQSQCNYDVPHIIRAVLEVESPVSEEWMLKRLVHLYDGREKVTSVVLREYEEQMRYCRNLGIIRKNDFLYLQGKEIPMLRVPTESAGALRDVKYIALEELALGLKELLKQNVSAEKTGLFRLLVQHLGFSRMGDAILSRLESALNLISSDIEINGDMLSLKQ